MNLSRYRKTATAVVTGAIGWGTEVVNSAPAAITASEWIAGATFLAIALGVLGVPNDRPPASTVQNFTITGGFDDPHAAAKRVADSLRTGGVVKARPGGTLIAEGGRDEAVVPLQEPMPTKKAPAKKTAAKKKAG